MPPFYLSTTGNVGSSTSANGVEQKRMGQQKSVVSISSSGNGDTYLTTVIPAPYRTRPHTRKLRCYLEAVIVVVLMVTMQGGPAVISKNLTPFVSCSSRQFSSHSHFLVYTKPQESWVSSANCAKAKPCLQIASRAFATQRQSKCISRWSPKIQAS